MNDGDEEFEAGRQEKIAEIRRTGKTWQWPDAVRRRAREPMTERDRTYLYLAVAFLALAASVFILVTMRNLPPG